MSCKSEGGLAKTFLSLSPLGGVKVVGGVAFLFLLFGGGEANISGSIGPKSVSGGSLFKGDERVCNICLDSVSKQISNSNILHRRVPTPIQTFISPPPPQGVTH